MSQILRPLSDPDYRALSGLLVAEAGVYVLGLSNAKGRLARAGLCTADGMVTTAGRAAHAAERARRAADGAAESASPRSPPVPDSPYLIAS
ncbi:MAG: hypothetical protein KKG14_09665 [Alphaproteobacteria bacterium]|nr:hypothetical protein [Alphaproteobacteria bacterium]MBU2271019.1 hypothetical protein [Alphaproteobacteria bacterium]MBU2418953.1 hypothetical protein [Alphaproteobacteria bacterium]